MKAECPQCRTVLNVIPGASNTDAECPNCHAVLEVPGEQTEDVPVAQIIPETRACPECGEQILAVARKCKHCGSVVLIEPAAKGHLTVVGGLGVVVGFAILGLSIYGCLTGTDPNSASPLVFLGIIGTMFAVLSHRFARRPD